MSMDILFFVCLAVLVVILLVCVIVLFHRFRSFDDRLEELEIRLAETEDKWADLSVALASSSDSEQVTTEVPAPEVAVPTPSPVAVSPIPSRPVSGTDTLYFGAPSGERMFDDNRRVAHSGVAYYCMEPSEDGLYKLYFCAESPERVARALEERSRLLLPVCELEEKNPNPRTCRTERPGEAMFNNGFWTVVRKALLVIE